MMPTRRAGRLKPPGFVHVDLDGLWTLARCYGFEEGGSFEDDPIFGKPLERLLDLLDQLGIAATFFIVGRDLELESKRGAVSAIAARGHALANHSYDHWIGLESLGEQEIAGQIGRTQEAIVELCGVAPAGFRAPGYDAGPKVLAACQRVGLQYDGSSLPTRWAPALRFAAGRLRARVSDEVARGRLGAKTRSDQLGPTSCAGQYGSGGSGAGALAPQWFRGVPELSPLVRLPLAVSPVFRFPLHASLGALLGAESVCSGLTRLARVGWPMTYLIHAIDCAAPAEFAEMLPRSLAETRGFGTPIHDRMRFLRRVLREFKDLASLQLAETYIADTHNSETLDIESAD